MANKFTKSVLERQAKEMKAQTAQPVQAIQPPPALIQEEKQAEEAVVVKQTPAKKPAASKAGSTPDLTEFIIRDSSRTAKNKTFYLDTAVIDAIHHAAAAQKITDSKLVNDIMKKILGV